ncbi:FxsB family radical SAM/SPASM domain protein, partial [Micromonospora ureilytica]
MVCRCGPPGAGGSCRRISQFVLKVHSRCDLSCDHCYIYQHADQTWRGRPTRMPPATAQAAARRIAEHAREHGLPVVHVVLHGGEPLLLGAAGLREVLAELRSAITPWARLDLRMQTNGVLLDEELCRLFVEYDLRVGVSFDGDRAANDRHRVFAHGGSSHDHVRRALALLRRPEHRTSYAGILCTVDVRNDPDRVYEALLAESPPRVDLLLPHATWDQP